MKNIVLTLMLAGVMGVVLIACSESPPRDLFDLYIAVDDKMESSVSRLSDCPEEAPGTNPTRDDILAKHKGAVNFFVGVNERYPSLAIARSEGRRPGDTPVWRTYELKLHLTALWNQLKEVEDGVKACFGAKRE